MAVRRIAHFGFRPGRRNAEGTVISREIPKSRRSDLGRDAARHVATNAPALNMPCGTASQGRGDSIGCAYIWWIGGRGNLRENREDPAPTVGIAGIPLRQTGRLG